MTELCDCCGGTGKPISNLPCICGRSGKMIQAYYNLREKHIKLIDKLEQIRILITS